MKLRRLGILALLLACSVMVSSSRSQASSPVTVSKTILFTQTAGTGRYCTVAPELIETVSLRHYRSRAAVAPPSAYVEASQGEVSLGGCWADATGHIEFSSGAVLSDAAPLRLTYSDTPSSSIATGSIHRLTREGPESWPSLAASQANIWLAKSAGSSSVSLSRWTKATGLLAEEWFSVGDSAYPAARSCVVAASTGELLFICDRPAGGEYALQRFSPPSTAASVIRTDSFPHSPVATALSSSTLNMRYPRTQGGSTYVSEHEMYFRSAGDSATLLYLQVPTGLNHIGCARAGNGTIWTVGVASGQVSLYKGQQSVSSFAGETPVVSPTQSGSTQLMAVLCGQACPDGTAISVRLFDIWGFPVGGPRQLLVIPGTVTHLSAASLGDTRVLIAWSQAFCTSEQIFMSCVDVRP
jgi:hypothetical protein